MLVQKVGGTDDLGFSALLGGFRQTSMDGSESFWEAGSIGRWWTATEIYHAGSISLSIVVEMGSNGNVRNDFQNRNDGQSVRCVLDEIYMSLTVNTNPTIGGNTNHPANIQTNINVGQQINISATPASGYIFNGWTISGGGTIANASNASTIVTVNGNVAVTANFIQGFTGEDGYEYIVIGGKRWMRKNLNIETEGSWCYENSADSCAKYGRLYTWDAAMTACPSGWYLPTGVEWEDLVRAAHGSSMLKARSGWRFSYDVIVATDYYGFSALPGGRGRGGGDDFYGAGLYGNWWTATEDNSGNAYYRSMGYNYDYVGEYYNGVVGYGFSVRCVQE